MRAQTVGFTEQDSAAIRGLTDAHVRAFLDHDPEAFLRTCTDDITFLPPGTSAVTGRSACRDFLEAFPALSTFTAETDEVEGQDALAYSRGRSAVTFEDGTAVRFKWLAVHRRQADGSWKMARDAWNTDEPASR